MAYNAITNGGFDRGSAGWNGKDIEASYSETAYIGGGKKNIVAEVDGHKGQTTVMEQTIKVAEPQSTELTFDTALRNASMRDAGDEGFRVEVLGPDGSVIAKQEFFPDSNSWSAQSLPVTFPEAGAYTIRFTELGPDNSLGAIIDNVSLLLCFCEGTLMDAEHGRVPVEQLRIGQRLHTLQHGLQPIRWIGRRRCAATGAFAPVIFEPGAMGNRERLAVSPQHRMYLDDMRAELLFDQPAVLVPAASLVNNRTIWRRDGGIVSYYHLMFDAHEIVYAAGIPSESYYPCAETLDAHSAATQAELMALFPALAQGRAPFAAAAPTLSFAEAALLRP